MTPLPIDHVVFLFLAVAFPIWDFFALRRRAALIRAGRTELRMGLYRRVIGEEWLMAIALVAGWFILGRGGTDLGLGLQGEALAWAGYGLTILVIALLLIEARSIVCKPEGLASVRDKLGAVTFLLPHTRTESRAFAAVSVTAGICEEVVFRGYLIAYLMAVLGSPFWVAALLSSVIFGFAHAYQGPSGILRTAAAGGLFALLYGLTGSLWAPMVVHALMDIVSGRIAHGAVTQKVPESSSAELAAMEASS